MLLNNLNKDNDIIIMANMIHFNKDNYQKNSLVTGLFNNSQTFPLFLDIYSYRIDESMKINKLEVCRWIFKLKMLYKMKEKQHYSLLII